MPLQSPQTRSALYVPQPTSISQITELDRGATIQATTLNRGATIQTTALKWRGYFSAFTCTKLNQFQTNLYETLQLNFCISNTIMLSNMDIFQ